MEEPNFKPVRFVDFKLAVESGDDIHLPINPEAIDMIQPALIPSKINGPDGKPSGRPGAVLILRSGAKIAVDHVVGEVLWKIEHESMQAIWKPEDEDEDDDKGIIDIKDFQK